jgi:8-oxo-dGTP pyrophosphatase MutT (NUDIX family)
MINDILTHRIAVNAFLLNKNRFLLLKRVNKPLIWGPPGGRLKQSENPFQGLKREVYEETSLHINIIQPVITWFGEFNQSPLLSLDYLCYSEHQDVVLSEEHNDYRWLSLEDLQSNQKEYFTSDLGFQLTDFYSAWKFHLMFERKWEDLKNLNF